MILVWKTMNLIHPNEKKKAFAANVIIIYCLRNSKKGGRREEGWKLPLNVGVICGFRGQVASFHILIGPAPSSSSSGPLPFPGRGPRLPASLSLEHPDSRAEKEGERRERGAKGGRSLVAELYPLTAFAV